MKTMKKRTIVNRILLVLLSLLLLVSTESHGNASNNQNSSINQTDIIQKEKEILDIIGEERLIREGIACDAYDRMLASFSLDPLTNGDDYPSYYGGAYIDGEGDLVINITENNPAIIATLTTVTGLSEVKVQIVPYSYAELLNISRALQECLRNTGANVADKICGYGIDQELCHVRVYVNDATEADEEAIRTFAVDPEAIVFIESRGSITEEVDVEAGSSTDNASVAYRAKGYYNGTLVEGVMTAGHVVELNNYIDTPDGIPFAKCIKRGLGGTMDSAFCMITNSYYVPSNYIGNLNSLLSITTSNPPQNSTVFKLGQRTNLTMGTIVETAGTYNYNNVVWSNLTFATYYSFDGDSGGIVYRISSGVRYTVGIHRGRWDYDNNNVAVYVKASVQNSVLEVYRY